MKWFDLMNTDINIGFHRFSIQPTWQAAGPSFRLQRIRTGSGGLCSDHDRHCLLESHEDQGTAGLGLGLDQVVVGYSMIFNVCLY